MDVERLIVLQSIAMVMQIVGFAGFIWSFHSLTRRSK